MSAPIAPSGARNVHSPFAPEPGEARAASAPSAAASGLAPKKPSAASERLLGAAREFEAVFVRQLLAASNFGGAKASGGGSGYQGMATDALADGIIRAGGLGLSEQIRRAMEKSEGAHVSPQGPDPKSVPNQ